MIKSATLHTLGLDEMAVHFWRCRLACTDPLQDKAKEIAQLEESRATLIAKAQELIDQVNAIESHIASFGQVTYETEILSGCQYSSETIVPAWPWTWDGRGWDFAGNDWSADRRILQTYTQYPDSSARGGAMNAWGLFTAAFERPPIVMNRHFGEGFCGIYRDVDEQELKIFLRYLLKAGCRL